MNNIVAQITQARDGLRPHQSLIPDELTSWNLPGVSKPDIENAFNRLLFLVNAFKAKNAEAAALMRVTAAPRLTSIAQSVAAFPQNPTAYLTNIFTQMAALTDQFTGATTLEGRTEVKRASKQMLEEISAVGAELRNASGLHEQVKSWHSDYETRLGQITASQAQLATAEEQAVKNSGAVTTALDTATKSIASIKEKEGATEETIKQFTDLVTAATELKSTLSTTTELNVSQQRIIQSNLEDSNRVGMAASFNKRKDDLRLQLWIWGTLLVLSLGGIVLLGAFFILHEIKTADWATFLFKLPITAPLIWLAWFSGIQYRYNSNIREDYAFKNATAMAFEGYRKQAAADPDLTKELLQKSIQTFSQNPLRLFEKETVKETPVADLTEKITGLLEKILPEILKKVKVE